MSLSARRAWIEILGRAYFYCSDWSLSARRAWIEMGPAPLHRQNGRVALRKESVDRNPPVDTSSVNVSASLSARRAWIEITRPSITGYFFDGRSPQGERG